MPSVKIGILRLGPGRDATRGGGGLIATGHPPVHLSVQVASPISSMMQVRQTLALSNSAGEFSGPDIIHANFNGMEPGRARQTGFRTQAPAPIRSLVRRHDHNSCGAAIAARPDVRSRSHRAHAHTGLCRSPAGKLPAGPHKPVRHRTTSEIRQWPRSALEHHLTRLGLCSCWLH